MPINAHAEILARIERAEARIAVLEAERSQSRQLFLDFAFLLMNARAISVGVDARGFAATADELSRIPLPSTDRS